MSSSSVEPVWIPNYGSGLWLGDLPNRSNGITRGLREAASVCYQLPASKFTRPPKSQITAERSYIGAASAGLSFDDDVVRERIFNADPFNSQFVTSLKQTRRRSSTRRRNDISYLNRPVDPLLYLKRVKPVKSGSVQSEYVAGLGTASGFEPGDIQSRDSDEVSLTLKKSSGSCDVPAGEQETAAEWDESLLTKLSANTARWLAQNPVTTEDARNRLHRILDSVHGPVVTNEKVQLVEENYGKDYAPAAPKTTDKHWFSEKDM